MGFLNKVANIMLLNLLFIVFSIPLFTIGASFSAAYYIGLKMAKDEETYIVKNFWKAFRENFIQATAIWLLMAVAAAVLALDFYIVTNSGIAYVKWIKAAMMSIAFVFLMAAVYVFPLQARFVNSVKNTLKNALLIAITHFPSSLLLVAVYAVPGIILHFTPQAFPLVLFLGFGTIIYVKSLLLAGILKRYENTGDDGSDDDEGIFAESERIEKE